MIRRFFTLLSVLLGSFLVALPVTGHAETERYLYILANAKDIYYNELGATPIQLRHISGSPDLKADYISVAPSGFYISSLEDFSLYSSNNLQSRTLVQSLGSGRLTIATTQTEDFIFYITYSGNQLRRFDLNEFTAMTFDSSGDNSFTNITTDYDNQHIYYVKSRVVYRLDYNGTANQGSSINLAAYGEDPKGLTYSNGNVYIGFSDKILRFPTSNFSNAGLSQIYDENTVENLVDIAVYNNFIYAIVEQGMVVKRFHIGSTFSQLYLTMPKPAMQIFTSLNSQTGLGDSSGGGSSSSGDGESSSGGSGSTSDGDSDPTGGGSGNSSSGSGGDGSNNNGGGGDSGDDGSTDDCPNDPTKTEPGQCGCGIVDRDTDGDYTADCLDECPNDSTDITKDEQCGCGSDPDPTTSLCSTCTDLSCIDYDGDGVAGRKDGCPSDSYKTQPDEICGCSRTLVFSTQNSAAFNYGTHTSTLIAGAYCTEDIPFPFLEGQAFPAPRIEKIVYDGKLVTVTLNFRQEGKAIIARENATSLAARPGSFRMLAAKKKDKRKKGKKKERVIRKVVLEIRKLTSQGAKLVKRRVIKLANTKKNIISVRLNLKGKKLDNAILLASQILMKQTKRGKSKWKKDGKAEESRTSVAAVPERLIPSR